MQIFNGIKKRNRYINAGIYINESDDLAKEQIFDIHKSISEVAYGLGFKYPQHFTRLFKQKAEVTPNEYRNMN